MMQTGAEGQRQTNMAGLPTAAFQTAASMLLGVVAGCASLPTAEEIAAADYGADLSVDECIAIVERTLPLALKDPGSAQFRHEPCAKGAMNSVPIMGLSIAYGWVQKGEINAKNSFGGYVGFRQYIALIRNGSVVRYCIFSDKGVCIPTQLG